MSNNALKKQDIIFYQGNLCCLLNSFLWSYDKLESVNARLVVHLLFIIYNDVWIHHAALSSLKNLRYLNRYLLKFNFTFQIQSGINPTNTNFHKHIDINLISRLNEKVAALHLFRAISVQCNDLIFSKKNKTLF